MRTILEGGPLQRLNYYSHTAPLLPVDEFNGKQFFQGWESVKKQNPGSWVNFVSGPVSGQDAAKRP